MVGGRIEIRNKNEEKKERRGGKKEVEGEVEGERGRGRGRGRGGSSQGEELPRGPQQGKVNIIYVRMVRMVCIPCCLRLHALNYRRYFSADEFETGATLQ